MAARIAGVTLPNKPIRIALRYIYGIGPTLAERILAEAKVNPQTRTNDLSDTDVNKLRELVEKGHKVEGDLRRDILMNIKRLKEINSHRGMRHARNLPVHGQRTKTNSRTTRGNVRRTMGSGRKPSAEKT